MCHHLDRRRHPGEFSCLRDDCVIVIQQKLQHRHRGARYPALHTSVLPGASAARLGPPPAYTYAASRFAVPGAFIQFAIWWRVAPVRFVDQILPDCPSAASYLLTDNRDTKLYSCCASTGDAMGEKIELLQGTLDMLVLKTLASMGPLHGYGLARRIEQVSGNALALNQGTVYPALLRLEQRGWIRSDWGKSENNRRARFYAITSRGRRQLIRATEGWQRIAAIMGRFFEPQQ